MFYSFYILNKKGTKIRAFFILASLKYGFTCANQCLNVELYPIQYRNL